VRRRVLHRQRLLRVVTMVQQSRHFVQSLRERAAHGNIDFLKAAADSKYWNARSDRARDKRQCRRVTRSIMQGPGDARASIVPIRFDI